MGSIERMELQGMRIDEADLPSTRSNDPEGPPLSSSPRTVGRPSLRRISSPKEKAGDEKTNIAVMNIEKRIKVYHLTVQIYIALLLLLQYQSFAVDLLNARKQLCLRQFALHLVALHAKYLLRNQQFRHQLKRK